MNIAARYVTATIPALAILGFFVWFSNWIPQTSWEPPQKQEIAADMTPAQLAVVGENLVRQRGCMACHTIEPGVGAQGGGRGPNWAEIAVRRDQGAPGAPDNLVDYMVEALYEPGDYLVEGYANIMPAATAAPAKLTYEEVVAVVNYLQSLGGRPSVRVGDIPRPSGVAGQVEAPSSSSTDTDPTAVLTTFSCTGCHSLKPGEVRLGPPLDAASLKQAASGRGATVEAYIVESIVRPGAYEQEGFPAGIMPADYGAKLTAGQLQALVDYLLSQGGAQ